MRQSNLLLLCWCILSAIVYRTSNASEISDFREKVEVFATALTGKEVDVPPMNGARVISAIPYPVAIAKGGVNNNLQCPLEVTIWAFQNDALNTILAMVTLEDTGDGKVSSVAVSGIEILVNGKDKHTNAEPFKQTLLKALPAAVWARVDRQHQLDEKHTFLVKIFNELRRTGSLKIDNELWIIPAVTTLSNSAITFVGKKHMDGKHYTVNVVVSITTSSGKSSLGLSVTYSEKSKTLDKMELPGNLITEQLHRLKNDEHVEIVESYIQIQ